MRKVRLFGVLMGLKRKVFISFIMILVVFFTLELSVLKSSAQFDSLFGYILYNQFYSSLFYLGTLENSYNQSTFFSPYSGLLSLANFFSPLYRVGQSYNLQPSENETDAINFSFLNNSRFPLSLIAAGNTISPLSLWQNSASSSTINQINYYNPLTGSNLFTGASAEYNFAGSNNYLINSLLSQSFAPFNPFFPISPFPIANSAFITLPSTGRLINAVANLVLANPPKGMYCWEPIAWLEAGLAVGMWDLDLPVYAQSFDKKGHLLDAIPTYTVQNNGQTGIMVLARPDILLFEGLITADLGVDYLTNVFVDSVSTVAVTHRRSATCEVCHPTPPGHIANSYTWGNCHNCHNLGNVLHVHAYKANIPVDQCYQCHPSGCLIGVHGQVGLWCNDCHGNLVDAANNQMRIPGQAGFPYCADCHDQLHAENLPKIYMDSAGHGGVWCINCHGATHTNFTPAFGLNNCQACHTTQATTPFMGPDCGLCHGSSISPHLVR